MKKDPSEASDHPLDLLLPFLENELGSEETKAVEDHLRGCDSCSAELETYRKLTSALKNGVSVFCPEPWEIFEFAVHGKDPGDRIARHLNDCILCRDEFQKQKSGLITDGIPAETWNNMAESFHGQEDCGASSGVRENWLTRAREWFSGLMRFPFILAATATAILLVILLYPSRQPGLNIALSSEDWSSNGKPLKLMAIGSKKTNKDDSETAPTGPRTKIAIALLFENSTHSLNSQQVDELFRFMRPPSSLTEKFDFVAPRVIKESVESGLLKTGSLKQLIEGLREKLQASEVMIISVAGENGSFRITGQLISADTGKLSRELVETGVKEGDLGLRLERIPVLLKTTDKAP